MAETSELLRRALAAIAGLKSEIEDIRREPIAILGMACRFPGADDIESFWLNLTGQVDSVREIPADRENLTAHVPPAARWGGFLNQLDEFDAEFFGISPREAEKLDPQQRLLLEVSWEAFEDACLPPDSLFGTSTGVFVGISSFDYAIRLLGVRSMADRHAATGALLSPAAGRLSYAFGFQGPSLAVDTACSSSLVAVHTAVQSLRSRDCDTALVMGVNRLLEPDLARNFAEAGMLSPTGRCRVFDAQADGFVRAEGCAGVVLRRLSDAVKDRNRIRAVIRGCAVNQDGRSSGLTVPNGPAQEAVLRRALANAGVSPAEVAYVEAHGTGTRLGDPIEMRAIGNVYGEGRSAMSPVLVGALKSHVGHMEAASGLAGLVKAALAIEHAAIPGNLHFRTPSPEIPWDELPVAVPKECTAWPEARPRRAAVSAFGFAGTNAHAVLEEAPATAATASDGMPDLGYLIALAARDENALRGLATRYRELLCVDDPPLADLCYSANTGRAQLPMRAAFLGRSRDELVSALLQMKSAEQIYGSAAPELHEIAWKWVRGDTLDWQTVDREPRKHTALPLYPWQRKRGWIPPVIRHAFASAKGHSVLGEELPLAGSAERRWHKRFAEGELKILSEHRVLGRERMPASASLDALLAAAREILPGNLCLERFEIVAPFEPGTKPFEIQVVAHPPASGSRNWSGEVFAKSGEASEFVLHARAAFTQETSIQPLRPSAAAMSADPEQYYEEAARRGLEFGPSLRLLRAMSVDAHKAAGLIASPDDDRLHPAVWDACLQVADAALQMSNPGEVLVPVGVARVRVRDVRPCQGHLRTEVRCEPTSSGADVSCDLFDSQGNLLAQLEGVELRRIRSDSLASWFHTVVWEPYRLWDDNHPEIHRFCQAGELLDRLGRAWAARTLDGVREVPRYARLCASLRNRLTEADRSDPVALESAIAEHFPEIRHELALVSQCGRALHDVLTGTRDPLAVLFPNGDTALTGAVYAESPGARLINRAVAKLARDWISNTGRRVRVLEIGAGSGATAREVLRACSGHIAEYVYSDLSRSLAAMGRALDGHGAQITTEILDIEQPQSAARDVFDVIIAVNVLHSTRDVRAALHNVSTLAAAGALTILVEPVEPRTWVDITFGLSNGWWHFKDLDLRPSYPLLGAAQWRSVLQDCGFESTAVFDPAAEGFNLALPQVILAAHKPALSASDGHVIDLSGTALTPGAGAEDLRRLLQQVTEPLLAGIGEGNKRRISVLTCGGVAGAGGATLESLPQAMGWGVTSVARLEFPQLELRHIDRDPNAPPSHAWCPEPVTAVRDGRCLVPRLVNTEISGKGLSVRADATYIVAGGTSGLGLLTAEWLVGRGARNVIVTGRNKPRTTPLTEAIRFMQADVTDAECWRTLFELLPPVAGVVLAAGTLDDGVIPQLDWMRMQRVLAPKAVGAWNLFNALPTGLDWILFYSSAVSLLGNHGQASHAAANSFLDAFAHVLRGKGLPAIAVNWGPVEGTSAMLRPQSATSLRGVRMRALPKEKVFDVLDRLSVHGPAQIGVFQADWESAERDARLLSKLRSEQNQRAPANARREIPRLDELAPEQRAMAVQKYLLATTAEILGIHDADTIELRRGFFDMGMDSLGALEMRSRIEQAFSVAVPATFIFRYPTMLKLTEWLVHEIGGSVSPPLQQMAGAASDGEILDLLESELEQWERRAITK